MTAAGAGQRLPELPEAYVDHLVRPRNAGDLPDAHAAGEFGSMVGGLGVRLTLKYGVEDDRPIVTEARGRAFGSPAPVAALSWMTGALVGKTEQSASAITADDVVAGMTGGAAFELPERARLGASYVVSALHSALGDASAAPPADVNGGGILVCRCLGVGDRTIRRAIHDGARDPEAIGEACRACTGCRSCRSDLLALIAEELGAEPPPPPTNGHPIARIAMVHAGAALRPLGLPLQGADVREDIVAIRLGAPAEDAFVSPISAVAITRHVLREVVWDGVRVELA